MVRFGYGDADDPPKFSEVSKEIDGGLSEIPVANAARVEASCSLPGNRKIRVRYVSGNNVADTLGEWTVWVNAVEIVHGDASDAENSFPTAVVIEPNGYRICTINLAQGQWVYDLTASVSPKEARPTPIECDKVLAPLAKRASPSAAEAKLIRSEFVDADDALNGAYKDRLAQLSADRRVILQHQQQHWLRVRDLSCGISERAVTRDQWIKSLEDDSDKMSCASRFARARAKALLNEVSMTKSGYRFEEDPELQFAAGIAPICKLIDRDMHSDPQSNAIDWDRWENNELSWREAEDVPQRGRNSQDPDSSVAQVSLHAETESDFDFFNDGHVTRVLRSSFEGHYMSGSILLVESTPSSANAAAKVSDPIGDPASWFLPCQLESIEYPISECPPFSQAHDEAGLSVAAIGGKVVRFRGRYASLNAVRVRGTTYVIIDGNASGTTGYTAVLRPRSGRAFDTLCPIRH
jgi:uncharacterized protein YecT (DUF1311 family)